MSCGFFIYLKTLPGDRRPLFFFCTDITFVRHIILYYKEKLLFGDFPTKFFIQLVIERNAYNNLQSLLSTEALIFNLHQLTVYPMPQPTPITHSTCTIL